MQFDPTWRTLRERLTALPEDAVLVTPESEEVLVVDRIGEEWLVVQFRDGGERTLPREQFARLADRVDEDGLALDALPPGVGPYVSVLSLAPEYEVDGGRLRRTDAGDQDRPGPTKPEQAVFDEGELRFESGEGAGDGEAGAGRPVTATPARLSRARSSARGGTSGARPSESTTTPSCSRSCSSTTARPSPRTSRRRHWSTSTSCSRTSSGVPTTSGGT